MADVTISSLTNKLPGSSAVFPYSEGGVTYNATLNQIIPTGVIMMWSGSIASIPSGWALCNGTNGTPDLRDRFIVGAGTNTPAVGTTGGSKDAIVVSHTHSINDPGHSHTAQLYYYDGEPPGSLFRASIGARPQGTPSTNSSTTGITINSTGSSGTNANLPPYYALAYIIKL